MKAEPTLSALTQDDLEQIIAYLKAASPPPVAVIRLPEHDDALDWVRDCLQKNRRDEVYGVALLQADGEPGLTTAITGNGPTSLANAEFYMLCHTAIPTLLAECSRLWTLLAGTQEKDTSPRPLPGTNTGDGHVWARPDGYVARCGGPNLCAECARDEAYVRGQQAALRAPGHGGGYGPGALQEAWYAGHNDGWATRERRQGDADATL